MLVFDEEKYAKEILDGKKYCTIKTQGRERCILVRYLSSLNKSNDEIINTLSDIPMSGGEYLSDKDKHIIYNKILAKANEYEFVSNVKVNIYKEEMDIIESLDNEYARNLLFVYLVYYKWASNIKHLQFFSKKNNIMMVVENNNDIWKLAGLSKLRVSDRYRLCNLLFNGELYKIDNFKSHNYIYIPFSKNDGELAIQISNYDNILGELQIYENPNSYKRCAICNTVIKKTRSPKKYCNNCAYKENIRKTKENKKRLKTESL